MYDNLLHSIYVTQSKKSIAKFFFPSIKITYLHTEKLHQLTQKPSSHKESWYWGAGFR